MLLPPKTKMKWPSIFFFLIASCLVKWQVSGYCLRDNGVAAAAIWQTMPMTVNATANVSNATNSGTAFLVTSNQLDAGSCMRPAKIKASTEHVNAKKTAVTTASAEQISEQNAHPLPNLENQCSAQF